MGEMTVAAFGLMALLGTTLVTLGMIRRAHALRVVGGALLLALAGAWIVGLPGAALGVVALVFLRRRASPEEAPDG